MASPSRADAGTRAGRLDMSNCVDMSRNVDMRFISRLVDINTDINSCIIDFVRACLILNGIEISIRVYPFRRLWYRQVDVWWVPEVDARVATVTVAERNGYLLSSICGPILAVDSEFTAEFCCLRMATFHF